MDGIGKATRQSFRMRGRSYVAFTFCPVVPIAGWLEEIDVALRNRPAQAWLEGTKAVPG